MKKLYALFISGLIALSLSMSLHAQSSQGDLDQAELMKQFIGSWRFKNLVMEIIPKDRGYELVEYKKGKGVTKWTWKGIIEFDQEYQTVTMFSLESQGIGDKWLVGKFVSDKKLTMETAITDYPSMKSALEVSFQTPDKFDWINKWSYGGPEKWYDERYTYSEEHTYTRIKEDVKDPETAWAPATQQKFDNIDEWIEALKNPRRDEWQKPEEVVKSLNLKPGDVVADIGAGNGYFTKYLVKAVSPGGKALGLDIGTSAVQYMKNVADKLESNIYEAHLIKPDNPELEPGSMDVVFLCNTYHHIENNRVDYFKKLSASLNKNGRVVIVDFYNKKLPKGFPLASHTLSKEVVIEEFRKAGYNLKYDKEFLQYQYYLEFGL